MPPAETNEAESHGFIQFEIESSGTVDEMTPVINQAGIFFDFNPPIITNEVENVLVSRFPVQFHIANPSCFSATDGTVTLDFNDENFDYYWNGSLGESFLDNVSMGLYQIEIFSPSGELVFEDDIQVNAPDSLMITAEISPDINMSNSGSIELEISGGVGPYSIVWEADSTNGTNFLNNLEAGTYSVTVVDENQCSTTADLMVDQLVANDDMLLINRIVISPNPASRFLKITCAENVKFDQLQVFSMDEKLILNLNESYADFNRVDVSGFSKGIYLFVFVDNGRIIWREKVVVLD